MSFINVKRVHIDKQGNFKMCYSVSNDSCPYRTASFYEGCGTVEEKVLAFMDNLNDDVRLTPACTGNVVDTLAYIVDHSTIEKPLSMENFDINTFMRAFEFFKNNSNDKYALEYTMSDGKVAYFNFKYSALKYGCDKNCQRGYAYASHIFSRITPNIKARVKLVNVRDVEGAIN